MFTLILRVTKLAAMPICTVKMKISTQLCGNCDLFSRIKRQLPNRVKQLIVKSTQRRLRIRPPGDLIPVADILDSKIPLMKQPSKKLAQPTKSC